MKVDIDTLRNIEQTCKYKNELNYFLDNMASYTLEEISSESRKIVRLVIVIYTLGASLKALRFTTMLHTFLSLKIIFPDFRFSSLFKKGGFIFYTQKGCNFCKNDGVI